MSESGDTAFHHRCHSVAEITGLNHLPPSISETISVGDGMHQHDIDEMDFVSDYQKPQQQALCTHVARLLTLINCQQCNLYLRTNAQLADHRNRRLKSRFKCEICRPSIDLNLRTDLDRHKRLNVAPVTRSSTTAQKVGVRLWVSCGIERHIERCKNASFPGAHLRASQSASL